MPRPCLSIVGASYGCPPQKLALALAECFRVVLHSCTDTNLFLYISLSETNQPIWSLFSGMIDSDLDLPAVSSIRQPYLACVVESWQRHFFFTRPTTIRIFLSHSQKEKKKKDNHTYPPTVAWKQHAHWFPLRCMQRPNETWHPQSTWRSPTRVPNNLAFLIN